MYYFQSTFFNFSMFCPVRRLLPSFYVLSSLFTIRRFVLPTFLTIRRFFCRLLAFSLIRLFFTVGTISTLETSSWFIQWSCKLSDFANGFSALGSGLKFLPANSCGAKLLRLKFFSSKCISCNVRVPKLEVSLAQSYAARNSSEFQSSNVSKFQRVLNKFLQFSGASLCTHLTSPNWSSSLTSNLSLNPAQRSHT